MGKKTTLPTPKLATFLKELGENIRIARLRRSLTATMLAERAGMSRMTLQGIEKGEPTVSIGAYANVFSSLGLEGAISLIARDDEFGRRLQDAGLTKPRNAKAKSGKNWRGE